MDLPSEVRDVLDARELLHEVDPTDREEEDKQHADQLHGLADHDAVNHCPSLQSCQLLSPWYALA